MHVERVSITVLETTSGGFREERGGPLLLYWFNKFRHKCPRSIPATLPVLLWSVSTAYSATLRLCQWILHYKHPFTKKGKEVMIEHVTCFLVCSQSPGINQEKGSKDIKICFE